MSGHSKWSTIKRQKGANDAKRGAVFTKLGNQIAIAARGGTDPLTNSSLAMIIEKAKTANMPGANIQRSIDRVKDKNAAVLEEITYEAYGPGGVGVLIECATDNKNRTFPEVKNVLTKTGGRVAEPGAVSFQFERKGVIRVNGTGEKTLLEVLDAGAEDAYEQDDETVVEVEAKNLANARSTIASKGLEVKEASLEYVPKSSVKLETPEISNKVLKLLEALDDLDDVVNVSSNADFT